MKRNKSFSKTPFYFIATPIGNLSEFSPRALDVLNSVDFICVEDTRTSGLLLSHFKIKKPLVSVHKFNEVSKTNHVITKLLNGEKGAFLSDAGYPLISDPGASLVRELLANDIFISVVNGPTAFLPALVASGLNSATFTFVGFLSGNKKDVITTLSKLKTHAETLLIYEAPHRVNKTVTTLFEVFGNRKLVIARELTKIHEEYIYTTLQDYSASPLELKGEIVLVVEGNTLQSDVDTNKLLAKVDLLIKTKGLPLKEAVSVVALLEDVSKNELYAHYIKR